MPEHLIIEETQRTPFIDFNPSNGLLVMKGSSIPEDTLSFYREIFAWLDDYATSPSGQTVLDIYLDYFNTSSSKCLYTIFKKLENIIGAVEIRWNYRLSDTDMFESGQDFLNLVKIPFKVIRITE